MKVAARMALTHRLIIGVTDDNSNTAINVRALRLLLHSETTPSRWFHLGAVNFHNFAISLALTETRSIA